MVWVHEAGDERFSWPSRRPWDCVLEDANLASMRTLTRNGIDPGGCRGDILGSSKKSVVTSIACKSEGLSLDVLLDSYDVVETGRTRY